MMPSTSTTKATTAGSTKRSTPAPSTYRWLPSVSQAVHSTTYGGATWQTLDVDVSTTTYNTSTVTSAALEGPSSTLENIEEGGTLGIEEEELTADTTREDGTQKTTQDISTTINGTLSIINVTIMGTDGTVQMRTTEGISQKEQIVTSPIPELGTRELMPKETNRGTHTPFTSGSIPGVQRSTTEEDIEEGDSWSTNGIDTYEVGEDDQILATNASGFEVVMPAKEYRTNTSAADILKSKRSILIELELFVLLYKIEF